ncbi:MAG: SDR family NAD(P)-dependent oxidoreductase [Thermoleophilaceae bacterium]|nr:SDR family NAD(P)-dependent oxidoreductase [Thermoleophilaceae bacterium]
MSNASVEGKTIVITGASDGIGAVAARALKDQGANVIITGRNPEKTKRVADELGSPLLIADFAEFAQVRRLAEEIAAVAPKIDVLANNAGGIFKVRHKTKDNHEPNFQINHLSPFLLTNLLKPNLLNSDERRIINTSSMANNWGHVFMGHLDSHKLENLAYGTSKLMNILFTRGIARKWADENFISAALHPGIVQSEFGRDSLFVRMAYNNPVSNRIMISNEQGATPIIDLVSREPREAVNGVFFMRHKANGRENKQARSESIQDALWTESEKLVGL